MEHKEESHEKHEDSEKERWWKGPSKFIIGLFLLLLVVLWVVPYYSIKLNPEPKEVPSIVSIQSQFTDDIMLGNGTGTNDIRAAEAAAKADSSILRQAAARIAAESCPESNVCHAKALYYFVRDNIDYVSDPVAKEYIASPIETIKVGGGDCDDGAVLLVGLLESVGIISEVVVIPNHALVRARIPEASRKQKIGDWVYLDWTCSRCSFGEIPYSNSAYLTSS